MADLPTGTVTFLFTDIEGSTNLARTLGARWTGVLETHHALIRAELAGPSGTRPEDRGRRVLRRLPVRGRRRRGLGRRAALPRRASVAGGRIHPGAHGHAHRRGRAGRRRVRGARRPPRGPRRGGRPRRTGAPLGGDPGAGDRGAPGGGRRPGPRRAPAEGLRPAAAPVSAGHRRPRGGLPRTAHVGGPDQPPGRPDHLRRQGARARGPGRPGPVLPARHADRARGKREDPPGHRGGPPTGR